MHHLRHVSQCLIRTSLPLPLPLSGPGLQRLRLQRVLGGQDRGRSLAPATAPTLNAPSSTTTGDFRVSWGTVTDAATYRLEERFNSGSWSQVYNNTGTSLARSNRIAGSWGYRVRACNTIGCGPYSAVKTVASTVPQPPPAPTGVQAVPHGVGCKVSWNASSGATYYELKKAMTLYSGPANTYTMDSGCPNPGKLHVRACNATTCSAWVP